MALFFFHFLNGDDWETDDAGIDLPSAEDAYLEAIAGARSMWGELLAERRDPARCAFEIADGVGAVLFRVEFAELLDHGKQQDSVSAGTVARLARALNETHLRASAARTGLAASLVDVRKSLDESNQLLSRLRAFESRPAGRWKSPLP